MALYLKRGSQTVILSREATCLWNPRTRTKTTRGLALQDYGNTLPAIPWPRSLLTVRLAQLRLSIRFTECVIMKMREAGSRIADPVSTTILSLSIPQSPEVAKTSPAAGWEKRPWGSLSSDHMLPIEGDHVCLEVN
jgi:hypothetical protein